MEKKSLRLYDVIKKIEEQPLFESHNNVDGVIIVDSLEDFNKSINAIPLDEIDRYFNEIRK